MKRYELTPHETVTVIDSRPELLRAEVLYEPEGGMPPSHVHPDQDETFEVLEGTLEIRRGGERLLLGAGDRASIPRGAPHRMAAAKGTRVRALWTTAPALRTEQWWAALDAAGHEPGWKLPTLAALLHEYRDVFRLTGPLGAVLPALRILAARRNGARTSRA